MGYFSFQHNAASADSITHLLQVFFFCLEKGKNWTKFGLKYALIWNGPWFGKMALRDSAEITGLIPFVTLYKHISQSWTDILTVNSKALTVSPGARPSALADTATTVITVMHTYNPLLWSITFFHPEKYSVVQQPLRTPAQPDVLIYPSVAKTVATSQNIYWCLQASFI